MREKEIEPTNMVLSYSHIIIICITLFLNENVLFHGISKKKNTIQGIL